MKIFDGAFGAYYISKTNGYELCERANINNQDVVISIHKEYISAGVNAIKTNTFSANSKTFENEKELHEIISQGYYLAQQAVLGTEVEVFADIGNISGERDSAEKYLQVSEIFIELGATNFLFETLAGFDEIVPAINHIKTKVKNSVIITSFAASSGGFTANGLHYKTLIGKANANANVDIVGLNCICGPTHILSLVKRLGHLVKPLAVMPNTGYPASINGRLVYRDNAEYFAEKMLKIYQAGAVILGGCCGTTPHHIASAVKAINSHEERFAESKVEHKKQVLTYSKSSNRLKRKPIAVELDPPSDCDMNFIMEAIDKLKSCGVTTITLADSPLAKTRADSFMTAALIKREKNIDVLPHLTCRDRNYIAIKGALLGASFHGINKVLTITGDPVTNSENYRNPSVFNFNSKELIKYIDGLNKNVFADKTFSIGGALNVNANNFEAELKRCNEKIENGAEFLLSQPLFSKEAINNFIKAKEILPCVLYAGILPFVSYRNAVFLNNEVMGIDIPQDIIESIKDKTPQHVQDISIEFCKDIITQVYDHADRFYIITPLKKINLVCQLIEEVFTD